MNKSRLLGALCACACVVSGKTDGIQTYAPIMLSHNDALITRDTETGLEWLDLSETLGQSINNVRGGYGGYIDLGFRYATTDEVRALYEHAPISSFDNAIPGNWGGVNNLLILMGPTGGSWNGYIFAEGFAGIGEPGADRAYVPGIYRHGPTESQGAGVLFPGPVDTFDAIEGAVGSAGSYLVRAVPLPAAAWLFGSGLLGLIGVARRRKAA